MKHSPSEPARTLPSSPILNAAAWRKRAAAFVVTSLAVLAVISLTWPLSIGGYRSEATIQLGRLDDAQRQYLLKTSVPRALSSVMTDLATADRLAKVQNRVPVESRVLSSGNIGTINERIAIGVRDPDAGNGAMLRIAFVGDGYPDEKVLVEMLANDIELALGGTTTTGLMAVANPGVQSPRDQQDQLDRAQWLTIQIEEGIDAAKNQTATLLDNAEPSRNASAFRSVGHVREIDQPAAGRLRQTLESVDVSSLRGVIDQLKEGSGTAVPTAQQDAAMVVTQTPVGAVPGRGTVLLLVLLSMLIGGAVAWNSQPFAATGFQSVDAVVDSLGVPVVATIRSDTTSSEMGKVHVARPLANRIVEMSSTILVAGSIVVGGFWFFYPSVRSAFGEGVFHGLARIVWMFVGA